MTGIESNPHPAIQLQYMEICARYWEFFRQNTQYIPGMLENFVRFVHHHHVRVRKRSWYLFGTLVKRLRPQLGDVAETVIGAISDLLVIHAQLPKAKKDGEDDDLSSEDGDPNVDDTFVSQLPLFEAVGCVSSISSIPAGKQISYVQSVWNPLLADVQKHHDAAKAGDERAVLQIHHDIAAFGSVTEGFSNWTLGSASSTSSLPAPEVSEAFGQGAEAVLVTLESLNSSLDIRKAARGAFSRLVGVLGPRVLPQLPRWIEGLLPKSTTKEEMTMFLVFLQQLLFGFKTDIYSMLDSLLTPLLQRVFATLAEPMTGTDDEIQMKELRREYLSILQTIFNNDLGAVLVSSGKSPVLCDSYDLGSRKQADIRCSQPKHLRAADRHARALCARCQRPVRGAIGFAGADEDVIAMGWPRSHQRPRRSRHPPWTRRQQRSRRAGHASSISATRLLDLHDPTADAALLCASHQPGIQPEGCTGTAGAQRDRFVARDHVCQDGTGVPSVPA